MGCRDWSSPMIWKYIKRLEALDNSQPFDDLMNLFLPAFKLCNEVSLMIMLKGRKQSYYFLLANFEATPQTVVGWTGECSLINEVAIRPCLRKNIHILLLQVR